MTTTHDHGHDQGVDVQTGLDFEPIGVMPDGVPDFDAPIVHSPNGNGQRPDLDANDDRAEEAVIGSLLIDSSAIVSVRDILSPTDFYIVRNQWIVKAIYDLHDRGRTPELVTVIAELRAVGRLDEIGGPAYMSRLLDVPNPLNVIAYAQVVAERAAERKRAQALLAASRAIDHGNLSEAARILQEADTQTKPKPDTWKLSTLKDAFVPRDPLSFIVEGLIVAASLIILYGAPGTLKSMLLADLAVCVAAGLSWLAPLPGEGGSARRVTQCAVLWCDFDNGMRRTHERFEALGRAYNVPDDIPLYYVSMPSPWLDASSNDSVVRLADQIREINAVVVIVDNLGTVTGKADENSAEMVNVMANLRWLAETTGAALIVIHHQRKGNGLIARAGETLRGHSSIEAALDLALLVERETGASLVSVKSTKTRDVDVSTFGAQFSFEHKDGSKELQAARFFGVPVEDTTSDQAIESAIIEAVTQHHPINGTKLVNAVKDVLPEIGTNRIRQQANRMVTQRQLTSTGGAHGARLYDLP